MKYKFIISTIIFSILGIFHKIEAYSDGDRGFSFGKKSEISSKIGDALAKKGWRATAYYDGSADAYRVYVELRKNQTCEESLDQILEVMGSTGRKTYEVWGSMIVSGKDARPIDFSYINEGNGSVLAHPAPAGLMALSIQRTPQISDKEIAEEFKNLLQRAASTETPLETFKYVRIKVPKNFF